LSGPYDIVRRFPWSTVPTVRQTQRRTSRFYYLLTLYLREHPPDQEYFRISELAEEFGTSYQNMYLTTRNYTNDSKFFLARIPIPQSTQGSEQEWEWAIDQLHNDGYYYVQPTAYHSGYWGEPSFRQFEDYDTMYIREAFNRVFYRLRDAEQFGLTLDGLNVREELTYVQERRRRLEDQRE